MKLIRIIFILLLMSVCSNFVYAVNPDDENQSTIEIPIKPSTGTLHRSAVCEVSGYYYNGEIHLTFPQIVDYAQIRVVNITSGKVWCDEIYNTYSAILDISDCTGGFYILEILLVTECYLGNFLIR
ncbi:MAG: hypothetical protein IJB58_08670 [Bacteroidales bacterium]|nr:hypothetical protein [Bacteroidales bacterium]